MDIKKYEVLLQALDSGNFSKVAQKLDYTQSAISHMMKSLEESFGFPVLIRKHSGIELTQYGEEVLPYIRTLVKANSSLTEQVSSLNGFKNGKVVIGTFSSFCIKVLMPVVQAFHRDHPSIQLKFMHGTSVEMDRMLAENHLDIGFFCDTGNAAFNKCYLMSEPMYVIVPMDHPCAEWKAFPYKAFEGENFVVPSSMGDCETSQFIKEENITVNCLANALNTVSAIAMVESGLGISIVSKLALEAFPFKVASIPLDPPYSRHIHLFTNKSPDLSPASKKFAEYCLDMLPA